MALRNYANSPATTLSNSCTSVATSITVASVTGLPASTPYIMIIDRGLATEEVVLVTAVAGTTLTVTRGYDSSTAFAHTSGASIVHGIAAIDPREANTHVNGTSGVHGVSGALVGTSDAQTLTNKTISADSNTISGIAVSSFVLSNASGNLDGAAAQKAIPAGAVVGTTDTQTLTNKTVSADSNTISGIAASSFVLSNASGNVDGAAAQKVIPAGVVVGTTDAQTLTNKTVALGSNTVSGTKAQFDTACTDADFASLTGTETLTNKTLTSPTVTNQTLDGVNISAAWAAYSPTLSNWTLGNGVLTGAFTQIGKTVHYRITYTIGTTDTISGTLIISLPVTSIGRSSRAPMGTALCVDTSAGTRAMRHAGYNSTGSILFLDDAGALVAAANPFTWASTDVLEISGTYEAA